MSVRYSPAGSTAKEIAAGVEQAVAEGSLTPGAEVTPIRVLAGELGVNPNTVAAAYRMLRDRGVVETGGRRGTRVRSRPAVTPVERRPLHIPAGVRDLSDGRPATRMLPRLVEPLRIGAAAAVGRGYDDPDIDAS
ncbi:MAG: GntR family transcriptional regulator, partial [Mycobacteriales bacterium]